ncbi:MAG: hypothetical protein L6R41_007288, partial [Letrouitia leprolyta]
ISDEQWNLIRAEKEAEGYDKDAYEHTMALWTITGNIQPAVTNDSDTYVFKLGGPLQDWATAGFSGKVMQGWSEPSEDDGVTFLKAPLAEATFVKVDGATKRAIEQWLATQPGCNYRPNFVRLSMARKDLDNDSLYPTLGIDSTLPQYRGLPGSGTVKQNDYPVWFFFYGTLGYADLLRLQDLLDLDHLPEVQRAHIERARLESWGGKYKALLDGPLDAILEGIAYEVEYAEHEETLRCYETENYEVVRCTIIFEDGRRTGGLTFRFANPSMVDDSPISH